MEIPGYQIDRCIGQGGMATAYLAEQTSLGRQVVLKVLDTSVNDNPKTVERFLNEGRIVAALEHPHIITIYDVGTVGEHVYISMEYVEGGDLKLRLQEQLFAPLEAIDIIEKIAGGLAEAHKQGIVHRDVKPGNILFRKDGTPLLSDFGIAKSLSGDNDLTATGMFLGSPNYMAPEQADTGPIDGRADIYSLGVIFYEMVTGQKPYHSDSIIDVIYKHRKEPIPLLPAGLEPYQEFLNLLMAKERSERFRNVESLLHYIVALKHRIATQANGGTVAGSGLELTQERMPPEKPHVTRIQLVSGRGITNRKILLIVMTVCVAGYGGLLIAERRLREPELPNLVPISAHIEVIAAPSEPAVLQPGGAEPQAAKVRGALQWLGRHSLNEYRLTAPPQDNAYYYFSRLLQMDPNNAVAREGLLDVAARYAILAEREIANDNHRTATTYISLGLQVDPDNAALQALRDLTAPIHHGVLDSLLRLFR